MIKVVGVWEKGWTTPIMEFDLWNFPLRDFGVDEFIMTPISGIEREVTEYKSLEEAIASNPELTPVYIQENGAIELANFEHPKDALYILGKVGFDPKGKVSVRIDTPNKKGLMWPHQVIAIVLRDRWLSQ